jgi:hypothetical protein
MTNLPQLIRPMPASLRHEFPFDDDAYGWEQGARRGAPRGLTGPD